MANILITGGSGLIGKSLIPKLIAKGHSVSLFSRSEQRINQIQTFLWDVKKGTIDKKAFKNIDFIIHLAGAGIADKRWTEKRKKEIIDSRVNSTELLFKKVNDYNIPLKGFISASAIGYYGAITSEKEFEESDPPANDFLGTVCQLWEQSALKFEDIGIPTTILRTGIVLSQNGGALAKMKTPIITPIGSGNQFMPWIHIDDMCQLYIEAISGNLKGIYNAVAPQYQTNASFSKSLAKSLKRVYIPIGVPSFVLKLVFGELAIILTTGSKISAQKLLNSGYVFRFPTLKEAVNQLTNS